MLVLTRKPGETIVIGDDIRITVVSLGPGRVKIGVVAPPSVRVDRQEIHEARQAAPVANDVPVVVEQTPSLHNRIAGQLPPESDLPPVENRLNRHGRPLFPPRKPR